MKYYEISKRSDPIIQDFTLKQAKASNFYHQKTLKR